MISITSITRVSTNEIELVLNDGFRKQTYSMYYELGRISRLTWDQTFEVQFGRRLFVVLPIVNAILASFCNGSEIDISIKCEGELLDIPEQPGKGAGWSWAKDKNKKI